MSCPKWETSIFGRSGAGASAVDCCPVTAAIASFGSSCSKRQDRDRRAAVDRRRAWDDDRRPDQDVKKDRESGERRERAMEAPCRERTRVNVGEQRR